MPVLGMPRFAKRVVVLFVDASLCVLTVWLAYYLRMGYWVSLKGDTLSSPMIAVAISLATALPIFIGFGLYRAIFRYSGWSALLTVVRACAVYGLIYASILMSIGFVGVPRTLGIIEPILLLFAIALTRVFASYWLGRSYRRELRKAILPKVLIYGAGSAGRQLAAALQNSQQMKVVGFLDDASELWGQTLNGIAIHKPADLLNLVSALGVSDVLLALPLISRQHRNTILEKIAQAKVSVRTLPSLTDLASGKIVASDIRELDIEDLLGRDPVKPDLKLLTKNTHKKVVVVTGAGGSIGGELCRQIIQQQPKILILIEQNEFTLYSIMGQLEDKLIRNIDSGQKTNLVPILASVRDEALLNKIFATYHPHIVFHAAAYKHVPLVEANAAEGILNNAFGTLSLARAAIKSEIPNVLLISTDKAVRPTNVMGVSKRLAEMILQAFAADPVFSKHTTFSMVRFGNVLDSSGSVVPLFRSQIQSGGPITLTHSEITRYFMTIPEAAQLVIQASSMAVGGDVFLLDMGKPVRIADLACRMIELSGLEIRDDNNPDGDIEIKVIGLRPGEKLYEELLVDGDPTPTIHPRIFSSSEEFIPYEELRLKLNQLEKDLLGNDFDIKAALKHLVNEFEPNTTSE
ncbi:polysaccharide biosynthesis protein [Polynucleobacter paneuropaeus]|nr:polysaccharide biosynthesis protein [Polynucleobacter paneuropaeus]